MTVFYALAIYYTNKKINETGLISLREDHEEKQQLVAIDKTEIKSRESVGSLDYSIYQVEQQTNQNEEKIN